MVVMLGLCERPKIHTTYFSHEEAEEGEDMGIVFRREVVYVPWRPRHSLTE